MRRVLTILLAGSCLTLVLIAGAAPASAITAELAIKCRKLALEAHPPARTGSKTGTGAAERTFYEYCINHDGSPPPAAESKPDGNAAGNTATQPAPAGAPAPAKPQ